MITTVEVVAEKIVMWWPRKIDIGYLRMVQ